MEGEYVGGTTFTKAYISDASGIAWAKFYVDGVPLGYMWQEADYWRYNWNTSDVTMGTHTIKVEAADNCSCHNVGSVTRGVYVHPSVSLAAVRFPGGHTLWERDTDQEITPPPQWQPGWTNPFAYTISSQMTVGVLMTSSNVAGTAHVRYVVSGTWSDGGTYSADKTGMSGPPCWLSHYPTARSKVMDYTLSQAYTFYVRKSEESDWAPAGSANASHPQVYLTFGTPVGPWGPSGTPRACWSRVLKDACEWMPDTGYGSGEALDARKRLAFKAYWSGGKSYNSSNLYYVFYPDDDNPTSKRFNCWQSMHDTDADCQVMSLWWQALCHSLGIASGARRIEGRFWYKSLDPVRDLGWTAEDDGHYWNFHHVGIYNNVFDPCVQLNPATPRVPQDESIGDGGPYKTDLFRTGDWALRDTFLLGETDPTWNLPSEVN